MDVNNLSPQHNGASLSRSFPQTPVEDDGPFLMGPFRSFSSMGRSARSPISDFIHTITVRKNKNDFHLKERLIIMHTRIVATCEEWVANNDNDSDMATKGSANGQCVEMLACDNSLFQPPGHFVIPRYLSGWDYQRQ
ncbi:hypothetical protein CDAR_508781 [Caerostris darwini]|uniref:Uncharacterized protein n=1 Tax=Caerostris darwini TaxID=1538125 RepID=A0AAV4N0G9_9ARAC|nr:hypothetical protein CDAR_508781 [Caerostris darwini]